MVSDAIHKHTYDGDSNSLARARARTETHTHTHTTIFSNENNSKRWYMTIRKKYVRGTASIVLTLVSLLRCLHSTWWAFGVLVLVWAVNSNYHLIYSRSLCVLHFVYCCWCCFCLLLFAHSFFVRRVIVDGNMEQRPLFLVFAMLQTYNKTME